MTAWYRQSSKVGFNLTPVGFKGALIFILNALAFIVPVFIIAGLWPRTSSTLTLSMLVLLSSVLFFIYSLKHKADYTPHDQNEN